MNKKISFSRLPLIDSPASATEILKASFTSAAKARRELSDELSRFVGAKHIFLTNSGSAAFYIILEALKKKSSRNEVVLPAYTAGSLVVSVRKAGLVPVICDISLTDFNIDISRLSSVVSGRTLAVVAVHMFGIPMVDIKGLRAKLAEEICLIEDCAQAAGSNVDNTQVGNFSDCSFFSFNRGKNLPSYGGGFIATGSEGLAQLIEKELSERQARHVPLDALRIPFMFAAFTLAVNRFVYALFDRIINRFRDTAPPKDIEISSITGFQAGIIISLLRKVAYLSLARCRNGQALIDGLRCCTGVALPVVSTNLQPAFNRFPLLIRDIGSKEAIKKELLARGIEASQMYEVPLHQMFDLGYEIDDFPSACYLARHLLTLPVHPCVKKTDLSNIIEVIRSHDTCKEP